MVIYEDPRLTPIAERLAAELSLPVFTTYICHGWDSITDSCLRHRPGSHIIKEVLFVIFNHHIRQSWRSIVEWKRPVDLICLIYWECHDSRLGFNCSENLSKRFERKDSASNVRRKLTEIRQKLINNKSLIIVNIYFLQSFATCIAPILSSCHMLSVHVSIN